ncbi:MAG: GH39 family glycosyl hydrolase [Solirubrobacteraceae bacterium]
MTLRAIGCRDHVRPRILHTRFGFNTDMNPQTVSQQHAIGATVGRLIVPWMAVEPTAGRWDWELFDHAYRAMLAGGLRPLLVAFAAPCWARDFRGCNDSLEAGPPSAAHDRDWSNYVSQLVIRYPAAIGIEIWNEPNLDQLFWPKADPARYTQLLKEAYAAAKARRPKLPVIGGSVAQSPLTGSAPGGDGDKPFLTAVYAAGGGSAMDAVSVHPYPVVYGADFKALRWDPAVMETVLNRVRAARDAAGEHREPIWITEVGESTSTQPNEPAAVSAGQQAAGLVRMAQSARSDGDLAVLIVHTLADEPRSVPNDLLTNLIGGLTGATLSFDEIGEGFGVLNSAGVPKPAACALSRLWHGSLHC